MMRQLWQELRDFISDVEDPNDPVYDPAHLAAMIVSVLFAIGVLFWLLWTLLVFQGGLFTKIVPAFSVLFTRKTVRDYGWVGYPFEMGIFNGFVANTVALLLLVALLIGLWSVYESGKKSNSGDLRP